VTADELKDLIELLSGIQTGNPARDEKLRSALIANAKHSFHRGCSKDEALKKLLIGFETAGCEVVKDANGSFLFIRAKGKF
jgi:hypothetical protein